MRREGRPYPLPDVDSGAQSGGGTTRGLRDWQRTDSRDFRGDDRQLILSRDDRALPRMRRTIAEETDLRDFHGDDRQLIFSRDDRALPRMRRTIAEEPICAIFTAMIASRIFPAMIAHLRRCGA
jgi:hypothetical protein